MVKRIIDERRFERKSQSFQRDQRNSSLSKVRESTLDQQQEMITTNPPRFTLTTNALVQLATALENAIKYGRENVTPSQGKHASSQKEQVQEDETYIPQKSH